MRSFCQIHISDYADPEANCRECDIQREMEAEINVWRDRARAAEARLFDALAAWDAVPGDVPLKGTPFDEAGTMNPDKVTP